MGEDTPKHSSKEKQTLKYFLFLQHANIWRPSKFDFGRGRLEYLEEKMYLIGRKRRKPGRAYEKKISWCQIILKY